MYLDPSCYPAKIISAINSLFDINLKFKSKFFDENEQLFSFYKDEPGRK
jgi:hypothetical protein